MFRPRALAALVALSLACAAHADPVRLEAQPLASALTRLANQSGIQILFDAGTLRGINAPAVDAASVEDALRRLLAGNGLSFRATGAGTYVVTQDKSGDAAPTPLPELTVTAARDDAPDSPYNTRYNRSNATAATKTDTRLMETPVSVQVIPQQVLKDSQAMSLPDAVNGKVSGVLGRTGGGFLYDNFIIRGLSGSGFGDAYRNGLYNRQDIYDVSNIEQIEILKGPAAVLYGRIEPGGLVNYVTKKPLDTPYYAIQQQIGSYHQQRTSVDATGPLDDERTLRYRVNASYTDNESFRDFIGNRRSFVAPSLSWRPNERFDFNVELEHKKDDLSYDVGIPAIGTRPADIPDSRSLIDGPQRQTLENTLIAFDWTWRFNDAWKLTQRYQHQDWSLSGPVIRVGALQADNRTLNRTASIGVQDVETHSANLDLTGKVEAFGARHELLFGVDAYLAYTRAHSASGAAPTIDIFNPVYGQVNFAALGPDNGFFYRKEDWSGVYVQDQMTFFDKLHILLGGRFDAVATGGSFTAVSLAASKAARVEREDRAFSPRLGVLYQIDDGLSVYTSYTESFSGNNGVDINGNSFDPQQGKQYEVGFKTESADKRLSSTVALFDLTKSNLLTDDPNNANPLVQILAGEIRSRGLEVDVSGRVGERTNLLFTYAYTDAAYTQDFNGLSGKQQQNVPLHQGSLWGTYQLSDRFKVGLGGVAVGSRYGDPANTYTLPGYARLDALAAYAWQAGDYRLTLQLNVNNVFDTAYYANSSGSRSSIVPGTPRNVVGSLKVEF